MLIEPTAIREPHALQSANSQRRWSDAIARHAVVCGFILALAWLAHFSLSRNIGLYSDDLTFAVPPMTWNLHDVSRWIHIQIVGYPEPQGRPLGFLLGLVIPYFAYHLSVFGGGGMCGMFFIGWLILSGNALLFYYLLRRCLSPPLPLLAATFFLLFPADTTRPFLCHAHILQPSLTFMLVAAHLYLNGPPWRRVLSYFVITLCLITYETTLLPFIAIPLLEKSRDRRWRYRFARHLLILLSIIALVYITRMRGGEYRAVEANGSKFKVLGEIIAGTIIGPVAIVHACIYRACQAIRDLFYRPMELAGFATVLAMFALSLWLSIRRMRANVKTDAFAADVHRATVFGAAATAVSYLFCFTHFPPWCIEGQETSVHLAAAIGGSTLLAALAARLVRHDWSRSRRAWMGVMLIALYFAMLFSTAIDEQNSYVVLWRQRQQFWTRLLDLCPDLHEGTMIICDGQLPVPMVDHRPIWFMPPNCWSDSLVLKYTYQMPSTWQTLPQVSAFPAEATGQGWRTWLQRDRRGRVIWKRPPYGRLQGDELIERNTILLHIDPSGNVTRQGGIVDIGGRPFHVSDLVPRQGPSFPTLPLYSILLGSAEQ
jgi:hypothetical protein